jgi:hypothetical protein
MVKNSLNLSTLIVASSWKLSLMYFLSILRYIYIYDKYVCMYVCRYVCMYVWDMQEGYRVYYMHDMFELDLFF